MSGTGHEAEIAQLAEQSDEVRQYVQKSREHLREYQRQWREAHPGYSAAWMRRRRIAKIATMGHVAEILQALRDRLVTIGSITQRESLALDEAIGKFRIRHGTAQPVKQRKTA